MTPAPGPFASIEVVATTPVEQHVYEEFQDKEAGFWTCVCYTCNRFFIVNQEFGKNHDDHIRSSKRKWDIELKRRAAAKVSGELTDE